MDWWSGSQSVAPIRKEKTLTNYEIVYKINVMGARERGRPLPPSSCLGSSETVP